MLEVIEVEEGGLPVPAATRHPEMTAFWEALRGGELLLPECVRCGFVVWSPRPYCPACGSLDVAWIAARGGGTVYSFTVNRRGKGFNRRYQDVGPYVVAYVELDEGPRVLTNIVECDPAEVSIGARVTGFIQTSGEDAILRFRLAREGGDA